MDRTPYRSELDAAHERISSLERQLARRDGVPRTPTPPELAEHLLGDERMLWYGQPDPRRTAVSFTAVGLATVWAGLSLSLVATATSGGDVLFGLLLGGIGVLPARSMARAYRDAGRTWVAITDGRILCVNRRDGHNHLTSWPLDQVVGQAIEQRRGGFGHLFVHLQDAQQIRFDWLKDPESPLRCLAYHQRTRAESPLG